MKSFLETYKELNFLQEDYKYTQPDYKLLVVKLFGKTLRQASDICEEESKVNPVLWEEAYENIFEDNNIFLKDKSDKSAYDYLAEQLVSEEPDIVHKTEFWTALDNERILEITFNSKLKLKVVLDLTYDELINKFKNPWSLFGFEIDNNVLKRYSGKKKDIIVPNTVKVIGRGAFSSKDKITSIILPEGLYEIEAYAFADCITLTDIKFPSKSLIHIGENAFRHCVGLKNIVIPDSVTYIDSGAFNSCFFLESIKIGNGIEIISTKLFADCLRLKEIILPDTIIEIQAAAFSNCQSLVNIHLPQDLISLGAFAFHFCIKLDSITIPAKIQRIRSNTFMSCGALKDVTLNLGLTTIHDGAFGSCHNLTTIIIPDTVKEIGAGAFADCGQLNVVHLPENLIHLGEKAFYNNTRLTKIVIPKATTQLDKWIFYNCPRIHLVVYKNSSGEEYAINNDLQYTLI